ncbi:hypothetical protein CHARACLAT_001584 [Characodon lateralis]|uniref:Uncharacterized protein n=1 Tax=Characodon lateralis TaxID=208331 RepID=A0ABU7D6F7_9TELE|nr:hypothetical protein [Characodon lateralis]
MGPQRWKTLAALRWHTRTPRPSMSGIVMELAEGGVRGWGGKDWGANRSPREPAPRLTPIGTPVCRVPTKEGGIGTSAGQKTRDRFQTADPHPVSQ